MRACRRQLVLFACTSLAGACGSGGSGEHGAIYSDGGAGDDASADAAAADAAVVDAGIFPSGLGAFYDSAHTAIRFRVYAKRATRVEVALFAKPLGESERLRTPLVVDADGVWSASLSLDAIAKAGVTGDVFYGYRAWGPNWTYDAAWTPGSQAGFVADVDATGNRYDPNKLLYDPYARELSHDPITPGSTDGSVYSSGASSRAADSARAAPKGIVLAGAAADFGKKPTRSLKDDVVYEVHVRGLTMNDPSVPAADRGTYRGAAAKAAYLADLGVTAIELQPIHETQNDMNDAAIAAMTTNGMNYWGYSTLAYFAPDRRYAADESPGGPTRELVAMVKAFHDAGIKVFLDVVYNHTGEGGISKSDASIARLLSWRGLDDAAYYELTADAQSSFDSTGTSGNFNTASQVARDLVVDSLLYWKDAIGIDGFRFDLAPVLGNACTSACFRFDASDAKNALNRAVRELPARPAAGGDGVDLIAEPWAIGAGTYQLGSFPSGWSEWNGSFRDTIRRAQNDLGTAAITPANLASRLGGSPDLYAASGRKPQASINYIASHDGFTLRDVYSYDTKANAQPWPFGPSPGGDDNNDSWSQGGDPGLQHRAARTGFTLAMMSAGVPMITGGDEFFRTQHGNNNAYNLDTVANWLDWSTVAVEPDFAAFARRALRFRAAHAALRPASFRDGRDHDHNGLKDVAWLRANGTETDATYMADSNQHFIAFRLDGAEGGDSVASIYVAYNAWTANVVATVPPAQRSWFVAADSGAGTFADVGSEPPLAATAYTVGARSVVVLIDR